MNQVKNIKGCILRPLGNFSEDFKVKGLLLPKDEISRNGILYDWDSIKDKAKKFEGVPMNFNHIIDDDKPPIGKITKTFIKEKEDADGPAGMYYEADIDEDSEYAPSIRKGMLNKVSIQVTADGQEEEYKEDGSSYTRAIIGDPLEVSVVKVPGFSATTMEVALAEAFKSQTATLLKEHKYSKYRSNSKWNINGETFRLKKVFDKKNNTQIQDVDELNQQLNDGWIKPTDVMLVFEGNGQKRFSLDYVLKTPSIKAEAFKGGHINKDEKDALLNDEPELADEIQEGLKPKKKKLYKKGNLLKHSVEEDEGTLEPDPFTPYGARIGEGIEDFPMSQFHKGLGIESKEHPDLKPCDAGQLVLDHLKEDPNYYNKEEGISTANIPSQTMIPEKESLSDEGAKKMLRQLMANGYLKQGISIDALLKKYGESISVTDLVEELTDDDAEELVEDCVNNLQKS